MNDHELLRILDFIDRIRKPYSELVLGGTVESDWSIVSYLIHSHLGGYPVSITSLALVSGLPHATAIRRIQRLIDDGTIVRRPANNRRTRFTLHPSPGLQKRVANYARKTKEVIAETVGARTSAEAEDSYYFGSVPMGSQVILPISLLQNRVERGVEVKFLLNNDNYFESMRNMWVDFRSNLASASNFDLRHQVDLYALALENGRRRVSAYDVMAVDMIVDPAQAEAILENGQADLVAIGREALYDPYWPHHAEQAFRIDDSFSSWSPHNGAYLAKRRPMMERLKLAPGRLVSGDRAASG